MSFDERGGLETGASIIFGLSKSIYSIRKFVQLE